MQGSQMQRAETPSLTRGEIHAVTQQQIQLRRDDFFAAGRTRFEACSQQQQQRRFTHRIDRIDIGTRHQQGIPRHDGGITCTRTETELCQCVQCRAAMSIGGQRIGAVRQQRADRLILPQCGRDHERRDAAGQTLIHRHAIFRQCPDHIDLTCGKCDAEAGGSRVSRNFRICAACQQRTHQGHMAAAAGTQQRRAALRIDGVEREAQIEQTLHRIGIATLRGGHQIGIAQRTTRQAPLRPIHPARQMRAAKRERQSTRSLAIGRACRRLCTLYDQAPHGGLIVKLAGQHQCRGAVKITGFRIGTARQQRIEQAMPFQAQGLQQRRATIGIGGERIGAALQQCERDLLGIGPGIGMQQRGIEITRQTPGPHRHRTTRQHCVQGRICARPECEQMPDQRHAIAIERIRIKP